MKYQISRSLKYSSLLLGLSAVALLGMGFSSFVINSQYSGDISVDVGTVLDTSSYFSFNNYKGDNLPKHTGDTAHTGVDTIKYNPTYGFLYDGEFGYKCSMTYYIRFDSKTFYKDNNIDNLELTFTLSASPSCSLFTNQLAVTNGITLKKINHITGQYDGVTEGNIPTPEEYSSFSSTSSAISYSYDVTSLSSVSTKYICFELSYLFDLKDDTGKTNFVNDQKNNVGFVLSVGVKEI